MTITRQRKILMILLWPLICLAAGSLFALYLLIQWHSIPYAPVLKACRGIRLVLTPGSKT